MKYRNETEKDSWEENDVFNIYLHNSGFLFFESFFLDKKKLLNFNIKQNRWYNILIEQKPVRGKVKRKHIKSYIFDIYIIARLFLL